MYIILLLLSTIVNCILSNFFLIEVGYIFTLMEFSDIGKRNVIWFLWKQGKKGATIHREMLDVYGDNCPSSVMIYKWIDRFNDGWDTPEDAPRSGRPTTVSTELNTTRIESALDEDRRSTLRQLEETLGISKSTIHNVVSQTLGMSRVSARWVPKLLTDEQKRRRVVVCRDLIRSWQGERNYLSRIVTGDETWVYHHEPESKVQSSQWKRRYEPVPIKARTTKSAGKRMATFFWDSEGIILINWLPEKMTINSEYYIDVLNDLRVAIKSKRRGKLSSRVLLQHDNARPHTSHKTTDAIASLGFELMPHPAYSPDLAPSDYWLFSELKKALRGKRFDNFKNLSSAVDHWVDSVPPEFFAKGIEKLPERWQKCIKLKGQYIENFDEDVY